MYAAQNSTDAPHPATPPEKTRLWGDGFLPILVFSLVLLVVLSCADIPAQVRVVTDNLTQCLGPLAAFAWSLFGGRTRSGQAKGLTRFAPTFLGLGAFSYGIGQAIWSCYELILHRATPFPSWADAGYLIAYPFLLLGVLGLPTRPLPLAARLRALSDSVLVVVSLTTFSWYFVLGPTLMQGGENGLARLLGTAYPLSDLVLLCCVCILSFREGSAALRPVIFPLGLGLASVITIDSVFDYQTLHNTYQTGRPIDVAWTFGYMLVAVAARAARRVGVVTERDAPVAAIASGEDQGRFGRFRGLMPYTVLPAVAGLIWYTAHTRGDEKLEPGVYLGAFLVAAVLLLRQSLTLVENQTLARQLQVFNVTLEQTVEQRTAELAGRTTQLAALQLLTAAVSGTLDADRVLSVAARHAAQVLNADGAAVWLTAGEKTTDTVQFGLDGQANTVELLRLAPTTPGGLPLDAGRLYLLRARLRWQDQKLGWVGVVRKGRDFDNAEFDLLQSVGLQIGTALANARQYEAARAAADHDAVTGLLNHRAIHQYLDAALEEAAQKSEPLSVIMADLDNFKLFNATYGHPMGDRVLQRVGQLLTEICGKTARVSRYGGDEFLIALTPGRGTREALTLATLLRDRFATEEFRQLGEDRAIPLALSFGVASFPSDSANRHDLLDTADANLYAAKNSDERIMGLTEMQRVSRELLVHNSYRVLDAMVTAVDNKDHYTRKHSGDVTDFALWIAEEIGLGEEDRHTLRIGGLLHDVGKIGVPNDILRKPGRLTPEEFDMIKQHAPLGAMIVAGVPGMRDVLGAVRHHHERWDGSGYPDGLAGEAIPLDARVLAVADAMSAMTTDRPYRKGLTWEAALEEVRRCSGTQFDPTMADAFLRAAEARRSRLRETAVAALPKAA